VSEEQSLKDEVEQLVVVREQQQWMESGPLVFNLNLQFIRKWVLDFLIN
jgi:hypothetical protein